MSRECGHRHPKVYVNQFHRDFLDHKTGTLDQERYEVACLRQNIIDEYERKSGQLLECLNSMETAFDRQKAEHENREAQLLAENEDLKNELQGGCRAHLEEHIRQKQDMERRKWETRRTIEHLREENEKSEKILKREQRRVQELEGAVIDLQLEVQRQEDIHFQKSQRQERTRKKLEKENVDLRTKAKLGWMVGCLSELYLRLDPDLGVGSVLKLLRKVQKELECGTNVFSCHGDHSPQVEYDIIQSEIRKLINRAKLSPSRHKGPAHCLLKDSPRIGTISELGRKRICNGRSWQAHLFQGATLKETGGRIGCTSSLDVRCGPKSPDILPLPEASQTPCRSPCLMLQRSKERAIKSVRHPSFEPVVSLRKTFQDLHRPLITWKNAAKRSGQDSCKKKIRAKLKNLEASITFILGQERRRRKAEGRSFANKPFKPEAIYCTDED